jgi:hypothetical protein
MTIPRRSFLTMAGVYASGATGLLEARWPDAQCLLHAGSDRKLIDVKSFGATGDGKSDDTSAIAAATRAAEDAGKASVCFSRGRYRFSSLDLHVDDLELHGAEAVLDCMLPPDADVPAIRVRGRKLWVHDINLQHTSPVNIMAADEIRSRKPNSYGLRVGGVRHTASIVTEQLLLERVRVSDARGGGIQVSRANNVIVRDCIVRRVLGNGIGFDGCEKNVLAERNDIAFAGDDLLVVVTDNTVPGGTRNVLFRNNRVKWGFAKGIATTGCDGMRIENNFVNKTFGGGIVVFQDRYYGLGPSNNVVVNCNRVRQAGHMFGPGLYKSAASEVGDSVFVSGGSHGIAIIDNDLHDSIRDGIVVTGSRDLEISRNHVGPHPGVGILVGDPTDAGPKRIDGFSVCDNLINGTRDGIAVGAASHGVVRGNKISLYTGSPGFRQRLANNEDVSVD